MAWTAKDFLDENIIGLELPETVGNASTIDHLFFSKGMSTTEGIIKNIYDTESYYKDEKTTSFYFEGVDFDTDDVYIQILKHNYEKDEYEYTTVADELPYFNMPWRNAITFLGRIIVNEEVKYKGAIILQFDGEYHNVVVVKPYQVNFGTFNQQDPLSITYNALDPAPFVFEDLVDERGDVFSFPTVLGVIPYNVWFEIPFSWDPEPHGEEYLDAKTFSSFNKHQRMYLKPYIAIPVMPQYSDLDYFKLKMRLQLHANDEGKELLLSEEVDHEGNPIIDWVPTKDFLNKIYDLSRSHNQVLRISLITEAVTGVSATYVDDSNVDNMYVDIGNVVVKEEETVMNNLLDTQHSLRYNINVYTEVFTQTAISTSYNTEVTITHEEPIINPETLKIVDYRRHSKTIRIFINAPVVFQLPIGETYKRKVDFEGLEFEVAIGTKAGEHYLDIYGYNVDIEIDSIVRDRHTSTGTTQPIIVRGEKLIDPEEMLKHHNLRKATMFKNLDRYGILYGPHMGSNVIQFLGYDQLEHAPYPFHAVDFDSEVVHIHTHRNNIYVFTQSGLYILHDGFGPLDMKKTFAYANIGLDHSEKNTVVSFGNEVFYISRGVGYSIRTNINVESQDDVYVQPVTQPIGDLLKNPASHVKKRLEEGYGKILDVENSIKTHYYVKPLSSELYIFATYYIENVNDKEALMVTYIFDKDYRRWKTYDTIVGMQPIADLTSGYAKGFDLIMKNHYGDGAYTTYASYLQRLPENSLNHVISDISVVKRLEEGIKYELFKRENKPDLYQINPISIMVDTGSLSLNAMHTKKIRRIMTTFMDLQGDSLKMYMVPYLDNKDYQNRIGVEVAVGEADEYLPDYIENVNDLTYSTIMPIITPRNLKQEGFRLSIGTMQSTKKLSLLTQMNARGKLPGFRIYLFATDQFKIGDYGIVYRQQKAR